MKKYLLPFVLVMSLSGCATFGNAFQADPWRTVETVVGGVETAISIGKIIFDKLLPFIAPEQKEAAQEKFDAAVLIIKNAETVARLSISSVSNATGEKPDVGKAIGDLAVAASALQEVIDQIKVLASSIPEKRARLADPTYQLFTRQVELVKLQAESAVR